MARASSIVILLVTVPLALDHLGPERFGMWMIISSFAALMVFADLGLGNGVLNLVASASGTDDVRAIRTAASSGFVALSCAGATLAVAALALGPLADWASVLNVASPRAIAEAGPSVQAFILCLAFGLPAGLASKVQMGLQQGYTANLWIGVGGLLSLAALILAIHFDAGVPAMVLGLFGGQQLAMALNSLLFFGRSRPDLAPRIRLATLGQIRALLGLSFTFFLLQLIAAIAFRADALIVGQFFGATQAGVYAVYERLFSLIAMVVTIAVTPLWPAYGEAIGRRDHDWIRHIFRQSLYYSMGITAVASAALALASGPIVDLWVGQPLVVPALLVAGFAVWKVMEAGGASVAMLMNGAGAMRPQLILAAITCVAGLALKLLFVQRLGISSIVWITIATYSLFNIVPLCFVIPRLIRRISRGGESPDERLA